MKTVRQINRVWKAVLLIIAVTVIGTISAQTVFAATGQVYLSPPTASIRNQSTIKVAVRINPGNPVNAVKFTISWDATKLQYVGLDTSQSAFGTGLAQSIASNSITSIRGVTLPADGVSSAEPVIGDSLIAYVTFTALAGNGSTAITLTNANANAPDGAYTNPSVAGSTITFTTPTSTTPTTSTPTPTPSTTSTSPTSNTSNTTSTSNTTTSNTSSPSTLKTNASSATPAAVPGDKKAPELKDIQIPRERLRYDSASVAVRSNELTQVYIKYGADGQLNLQTGLTDFSSEHAIDITSAGLVPGSTYSYQIIAKDATGNVTESEVQTFKTKGFTVRVAVLDKQRNPLKRTSVVLHSDPQSAKTDGDGIAEFTDVAPGNHEIIYSADDKEYKQAVVVDNNVAIDATSGDQTAPVQNVSVVLPVIAADDNQAGLAGIVIATTIVAMALIAYGLRKRLHLADRFFTKPVLNPAIIAGDVRGVTSLERPTNANPVAAPGSVVQPTIDRKPEA